MNKGGTFLKKLVLYRWGVLQVNQVNNIHLMYGPEVNSLFCFPESRRGKTKLTSFPRDHILSVLLYI